MRKKFVDLCTDGKWFKLKISVDKLLLLAIVWWFFSQGKKLILNVDALEDCHVTEVGNFKVVNCSGKNEVNVFEIPKNFGENVQILDISYKLCGSATESDFEKYIDSLTELHMKNFLPKSGKCNFDENIFKKMHNLKYLDVSGCFYLTKPAFPPTLKILQMEKCHKSWDLTEIASLEELYAVDNFYNTLPNIKMSAPLRILDLRNNSLHYANLSLEIIAPLCHLTRFLLSPQTAEEGDTRETFCHCKRLEWWLENTDVTHDPFYCRLPAITGPLPPCLYEASYEAEGLRQKCFENIPLTPLQSLKYNLIMIVILLIILFAISLPFVIIARKIFGGKSKKRRKRRRKRLMKRWKKVGEEEIEEEYYEEYEEEGDWEEEELQE